MKESEIKQSEHKIQKAHATETRPSRTRHGAEFEGALPSDRHLQNSSEAFLALHYMVAFLSEPQDSLMYLWESICSSDLCSSSFVMSAVRLKHGFQSSGAKDGLTCVHTSRERILASIRDLMLCAAIHCRSDLAS